MMHMHALVRTCFRTSPSSDGRHPLNRSRYQVAVVRASGAGLWWLEGHIWRESDAQTFQVET